MTKRWAVLGGILLPLLWLVTGCGVVRGATPLPLPAPLSTPSINPSAAADRAKELWEKFKHDARETSETRSFTVQQLDADNVIVGTDKQTYHVNPFTTLTPDGLLGPDKIMAHLNSRQTLTIRAASIAGSSGRGQFIILQIIEW